MTVAYDANIRRAVLKALQTAAAGWTPAVTVKDSSVRLPFNPSVEDEAVVLRFNTVRRPACRASMIEGVVGFEIHCMTKRGDLRADGRLDRHLVLAALVEEAFRTDIQVYDAVGGNTNTYLGALQGIETTMHTRDKRNTIFGADVDYSVETPNVVQAVVVVTGLFQTSRS